MLNFNLLFCLDMLRSKNGMELFWSVSRVNSILGCIELTKCCKLINWSMEPLKISSMYLFQSIIFLNVGDLEIVCSSVSINNSARYGDKGEPMAKPTVCL